MDIEYIYTVVGALIFIVILIVVLKSDVTKQVQSKEEKRYEIISKYRAQLNKELAPLKDDKEAYIAKKNQLLKIFSDELSLNIFFDKSEISEIIMDLAQDT